MITMIHSYIVILLYLLLQLSNAYESSKTTLGKECIVGSEQVFKFQNESLSNITFFISSEDPITFQIGYDGLKKNENNDLLILKPTKARIQRKRGGEAMTYNDDLMNRIPLGWNVINITLQDGSLYFGNFYAFTGLEQDISDMSVTAKYMTDCASRTPTWEVAEHKEVSIPLTGLSTFEVRLFGEKPFHPQLTLNDFQIPLNYGDELFVGNSDKPLPADDYRILIIKHTDSNIIYIFTLPRNDEYKLLTSTTVNEDLIDLKVKTLAGEFCVTLRPFMGNGYKVKTRLTTPNTLEGIIKSECETTNASHTTESSVKCEGTSSIGLKITTALSTVIAAVSILIHYFNYARKKKGKYQEFDMEEGENLLDNLAKIPAKDKIRSDKTEPHGEFIQEFGYQKEICKLKFEPNHNNKYKKTLGVLDEIKQTKVILVVGETGSGKSSTINGMINHIYGINYDDPFRFKLIDDMDSPKEKGINTTEEITSYYIPYIPGIVNDSNYIIIDTPGFGDIRGIEEDTKMVTKFYDFLKENPDVTAVDAICFVVKASETRLTTKQEYIISGLFSLFGKDVKRNIYIVVTFSDGTETHVPELIKGCGLDYGLEMHFNVEGIFNDGKGIKGLTDNEIKIGFQETWDMTMSSMDKFFKVLKNKTSVILMLTNIVLEENKDITKLTDELLQLIENEEFTNDTEKLKIQEKIEQNQSLLMTKIEEAKKLTGRLKDIPCKENPMAINEYINILISSERDENKITKLEKVKKRNTLFQKLLKDSGSKNYNMINYFFGEKYEKME